MGPDKEKAAVMAKLYAKVHSVGVLQDAWRKVRENGLNSISEDTYRQVTVFDENPIRHLRTIQDQLRQRRFSFSSQTGVKIKRGKKKPRPLVIAPIKNRLVQRAVLDVLQGQVPAVKKVLDTRTSIGGIPGRGTRHGIALVQRAIEAGDRYYVRSDIEAFFTKIPRQNVINFVAEHVDDPQFVDLFRRATETELHNIDQLGEHRNLFPIGEHGVAQGSPLSPLMGNIVLRDFDRDMNGRDITCVRYIDDFILLGPSLKAVRKAFAKASVMLANLGMDAYDPAENRDKAAMGDVTGGIDFLGCQIHPGLVQPSVAARAKLLAEVEKVLAEGCRAMVAAAKATSGPAPKQRYAQTLVRVDRVVRGWGHAFSFCNGRQPFDTLDRRIDQRIAEFRHVAHALARNKGPTVTRRVMGVHLLSDTPTMPLPT